MQNITNNTETMRKSQKVMVTLGIMFVMFFAAQDMLSVAIALPTIAKQLGGEHLQTWVVTTYTLIMTIAVPIFGKLSDIYGRKYIYLFGIIVFNIASALCGASQNMYQLIVFRCFQGVSGGVIMGVSLAVISDTYSPKEVGKYMGIIMSMSALSSLISPALGGFLTDLGMGGWRWIFYQNVPFCVAAVFMLWKGLPKPALRDRSKKVDIWGAMLVAVFAVPLLLALQWGGNNYAWDSPTIITLLAIAAVSLAALLIVESKVPQPIIPLAFFKKPVYAVVNMVNFCISIAMMSAMVYMPQFTQTLQGKSATMAGAMQTPMMVCLTVGGILVGQLVSRLGKYKIFAIIGGVIACAGCVLLSAVNVGTSDTVITVFMAIFGFGVGTVLTPLTVALRNVFNKSQLGAATSSYQFYKNLATSLGVAILGAILTPKLISWRTAAVSGTLDSFTNDSLLGSFRVVFILCAVLAAAAVVVSLFLKAIPLRKDDEEEIPDGIVAQAIKGGEVQ